MTPADYAKLPFLVCLCPTYRRPRLLENAIACFEAQDYPADRRLLLILEDAGEIAPTLGYRWLLRSTPRRYPTLPNKYNALAEWARREEADAVVVWDDDDVYLRWHLSAIAAALPTAEWAKPARVWTTVNGPPIEEPGDGRFHGSLAIGMPLLLRLGGWIETPRADFDQRMIARLTEAAPPGDPCRFAPPGEPYRFAPPSYVFRWGSTGAPHCQGLMRSPDDPTWYARVEATYAPRPVERLDPRMDEETARLYEELDWQPYPGGKHFRVVQRH